MNTLQQLTEDIAGCVGVSTEGAGEYTVHFADGSSRAVTVAEVLAATKSERIAAVNAECRSRLIARFGPAEEQVSRSIGAYGAVEQAALKLGVETTLDASNVASNAILAAADLAAVEAVTVTWPVI